MGTGLRILLGAGLALISLLAGCQSGYKITNDYGVPPPPSHPTVELTDFSYTPGGPVRAGDTLTLTATTNLPIADASLDVMARPVSESVALRDDGQPPDELALDGRWTAEYTWPADASPVSEASFFVMLDFQGYYMWQSFETDPFEVLPAEGE